MSHLHTYTEVAGKRTFQFYIQLKYRTYSWITQIKKDVIVIYTYSRKQKYLCTSTNHYNRCCHFCHRRTSFVTDWEKKKKYMVHCHFIHWSGLGDDLCFILLAPEAKKQNRREQRKRRYTSISETRVKQYQGVFQNFSSGHHMVFFQFWRTNLSLNFITTNYFLTSTR